MQIFSQFGNEMVEFAHLTGDRQNVSERGGEKTDFSECRFPENADTGVELDGKIRSVCGNSE